MSMSGYTKLFNSILASTIWRADDKTRIVWITLLAMADKYGVAEGSIPGLADFARVSIEDCEHALVVLQSPDSYSRSKVQGGRRIEPVEGGWRLINHGMYRETMSADERREYLRVKQAEHREREKAKAVNRESTDVNECQPASTDVNTVNTSIEHRASPPPPSEASPAKKELSSADADYITFRDAYPEGRRVGGEKAKSAFRKALNGKVSLDDLLAAVAQHRRSEQWQNPALIPLMTTWLNQERWRQVLPEPKPRVGSPEYYEGMDYHCEHSPQCGTRVQHRQRVELDAAKQST